MNRSSCDEWMGRLGRSSGSAAAQDRNRSVCCYPDVAGSGLEAGCDLADRWFMSVTGVDLSVFGSLLAEPSGPSSERAPDHGVPVQDEARDHQPKRDGDVVELSPQATEASVVGAEAAAAAQGSNAESNDHDPSSQRDNAQEPSQKSADGQPLTDEQKKEVQQLRQRDQEVRRHEQAHKAAAGQFAKGGPSFTFQTGPDGKQYAVGGEVQIDTSPVEGDPQATIRKMETIQRAATAPAEPSSQDQAVAAQAAQTAQQARQELQKQKSDDPRSLGGDTPAQSTPGRFEVKPSRASVSRPGQLVNILA